MSEIKSNMKQLSVPSDIGLEDWEKLIKIAVPERVLIDLVKQDKHLQQREFHGFRPDHFKKTLQWSIKIAKHAQTCVITRDFLIRSWLRENHELYDKVLSEVEGNSVEESVAKILATMDSTEKSRCRLLWALILANSPEITEALNNGIREDLSSPSSALFIKVELYKLRAEYEQSQQKIEDLKQEQFHLRIENEKIPGYLSELDVHKEIIKALESEVAEYKESQQTLSDERDLLYHNLEQTRDRLAETEQSVEALKRSLRLFNEDQVKSINQAESQFSQLLKQEQQQNNELRTDNERLRLSQKALEAKLLTHSGLLEHEQNLRKDNGSKLLQALQELEETRRTLTMQGTKIHNLTEEKNTLTLRLEQIEREQVETQQQLNAKEEEIARSLDLSWFDTSWNEAVEAIAQRIALQLPDQAISSRSEQGGEKWQDWSNWQRVESQLVRPLLGSNSLVANANDNLPGDIAIAQNLLALRWYLLEWLKRIILDLLVEQNKAGKLAKGANS